ncbi:type II toxin-antitoxin system RelE/ParE family toxin [Turneriella parva]|uniref:Plasmid stabilization system n=1 Tax=Turneriella parva (strain ATCC BAA-1111 / DSM 21527 / NCTC 11395 / H) TaxID=869212 RepID=I4B3G7_TURPD|nr:type II toxin-antitoxin system RelE/ParE family toxin [Turneriella parva]AFM11824.1 plasmid stabilization system [Turneriella parva DSM 21527]
MKKFKVVWAAGARADFELLIQHLIDRESAVSEKIFEALLAQADSLETAPERGRKVPELLSLGVVDVREIFYKPWRIIYRISENEVRILMVIDGRRNLADELLRSLTTTTQ